jgi:hypothetical protein
LTTECTDLTDYLPSATKVAITASVAVTLLRFDETLIAVGIVKSKPFAVSLAAILAVCDNVALVKCDVNAHATIRNP